MVNTAENLAGVDDADKLLNKLRQREEQQESISAESAYKALKYTFTILDPTTDEEVKKIAQDKLKSLLGEEYFDRIQTDVTSLATNISNAA